MSILMLPFRIQMVLGAADGVWVTAGHQAGQTTLDPWSTGEIPPHAGQSCCLQVTPCRRVGNMMQKPSLLGIVVDLMWHHVRHCLLHPSQVC